MCCDPFVRRVWNLQRLPMPSRLLLLGLQFLADGSGVVTATDRELADLMACRPITVRRARRYCERIGAIAVRPIAAQRQGSREGLTYDFLSAAR